MSVEVTIKGDKRARRELEAFVPRYLNASMNRGMNRAMSEFSRTHAKDRLTKAAGLNIRRRVASKNRKGHPPIAAKARKIGFRAELAGRGKVDGKRVTYSTSSPVLTSREKGATIVPRRGKYLAIPQKRGGIRLVRRVRVRATLRLVATWRAHRPLFLKTLARFKDQAVARWNAKRGAAA